MLPAGTVTFVFTDIEGSTQLLQKSPDDFPMLLEKHNRIIRQSFSDHQGIEVDNTGDGFFFVFTNAFNAVAATARAQRLLADHPWDPGRIVRVRMGIHTGVAQVNDETYIGLDVHKAARIMSAAYGGQVLLSQSVASLLGEEMDGVSVFALGEFTLKDLTHPEILYQLLIEGAASPLPQQRFSSPRRTNLPSRATPVVGRQHEIEEIVSRLHREDVRMLTLAGPGGIGKTTLAIESSRRFVDAYPDGVFVVFLAPVMDAAFVPNAIAQVLGFFLHTSLPVVDQLRDHIGDKSMLLVLDNFEHLVPASSVLTAVLEKCPNLKLLITSRIVLKSRWEWEYPVPPFPHAISITGNKTKKKEYDIHSPSVELFVQRAKTIDPHFHPTDKELGVIAEICDRLDGLPLAIELAAARIKVLTLRTILTRLCKRLDLLKSGISDLPERHQTLRHAVGWSYDLLKKDEQALFRALGVFAGGFSLETAEAVYAKLKGSDTDALDIITSLRDQSLIRVADIAVGEARYMMLETIREYALDRLQAEGEMDKAHQYHAMWFLQQAEEASTHFTGPEARMWLDRVEADLDNYRSALQWCEEHRDAKTGLGLCIALWRFWVIRALLREGVEHLNTHLAQAEGSELKHIRAKGLNALGTVLHELSEYRNAYEVLTEAVNLLRDSDDKFALATALNNLGWVAGQTGQLEHGERYSREAYEIHQSIGNTRGMGVSMNNLGFVSFSRSEYLQMRHYYNQHYKLMEDIGDVRGMAYSLLCQTYGEQDSGSIHTMQQKIDRAVEMIREVDDRQLISWANTLQALIFFHTRKFENARQYLLDTVEEATLLQNRLIVSLELVLLGASEMKLGNLKQGKEYLKECLGYASVRGSNILTGLAARHLAEAYLRENRYDLSLDFIRQSYDARKKIQNTIGMVDCAELLVRVYVKQAKYVQATELLAGTHVLRAQLGYPFVESQRMEIIESRDELRSKMGETEFGRVWSEGAKKDLLHDLEAYLHKSVIAIANITGALP